MEQQMMALMSAVEKWRELNSQMSELVEEINRYRGELADLGIHITLDDFDQTTSVVETAGQIVPPVVDRRAQLEEAMRQAEEGVEEEEEVNDDEEDVPTDRRTAEQIRREAVPAVPEDAQETTVFAGAVASNFDKAVAAGFGTVDRLATFTPDHEGEVRTVGYGG